MGKKKLINAENYVVSFPLLTEKWQEDILDQRFELLRKIYNALQSKWQKKYTYVTQMKAYKECQTLTERSDFFKTYEVPFMNNGGKQISIAPFKGAYGMTTYVAKFASQYNKYGINSSILEDIANCCWSSWDKLIYHKGKKIHFKRKGEINSYKIRIKSERFNGIDKDELNNQRLVININGKIKGLAKTITIPFYVNPKSAYEMYAFMDKITCIAVKREVIRGKNRYFVQFTFEGKCSFIDDEDICKHDTYCGNRIHRGMFKTSNGTLINADVNGALNILKKAIGKFYYNPIKVCSTPLVVTP